MIATGADAKEIFLRALDFDTAEQQGSFVELACQHDSELRARVEALLRAHLGAGRFLGGAQPDRVSPPAETAGHSIGPYTLVRELGAGGMGVVWLAEQAQPVRRRVALKVVRPGLNSAQVISRFAAEREALALMDHPNIARVLDAGTTDAGSPYFVMELVEGDSITKFCDERRLTIVERLKLFIAVCQAVQHAHQKGVIHRDIKPSNVLVAEFDGQPMPKVIDFGVAKAIGEESLGQTRFTLQGQIIGTPEYMAPEQAEFNPSDIDTRCDIYALGVLLYELLTGTTPFDRGRVTAANLSEWLRTIKEVEPKPPSDCLRGDSTAETTASQRNTDAARLQKLVRGDLDWIVLKCLEKSRSRRYASAGSFADDIRRHLDGLPVEAHRPSRWYRAKKLVARNRLAVLMSAAFATLLMGGLLAALLLLRRETLAYEHSQRLLYCADMNLAADALRANDRPRLEALLRRHVSRTNKTDLRGFEWYHLWERLQRFQTPTLVLTHKPSSVIFAPDGTQFAVGLMNGTVVVYDAKTLHEVDRFGEELPTHDNWTKVRYSSDGSRLAFQSQRDVIVVALPSRQTVRLHAPNEVRSLAISGNGKRLAAGIVGGKVVTWDLHSTLPDGELDAAPLTNVQSLAFSHSGQTLVAGAQGRAVRIWDDLSKSQKSRTLNGIRVWGTSLRFSLDDKVLASSLSKDVTLWRLPSGAKLHELQHEERVHIYDFSPDGLTIVSGTRDGRIHVWDAQKGTLLVERPAHTGAVQALAFSPDSQTLITAGSDRLIRVWPGQLSPQPDFTNISSSVQFAHVTSDGASLVTVMGQAGRMRRHLQTWKLSTRERLPLDFPGRDNIECAAVSPRDRIAVAVRDAEVLLLENLGKRWQTLPISSSQPAAISALAFSPDDGLLAVGRENGSIGLWDIRRRSEIASLPSEPGSVRTLRFTRDSRVLAAARARTVVIWQRPENAGGGTWTEIKRLPNEPAEILSIEFDPRDDESLAAGTNGNAVLLWRWRTNQPPRTFSGHSEGVYDVAFSPDGMSLVSCGADQSVVFWDLATGQQRVRLAQVAPLEGEGLAFSPDGQTLISGDLGWRLYFWRAATKEQVEKANW